MTSGADRERSRFFISFAEPDRGWAEWTAWQLEAHGFRVEFRSRDWAAGDNAVLRLNKALDQGMVVALFSRAYFDESDGNSRDWSALLAADRPLIPLRIDDSTPPTLLRPLVAPSLCGLDQREAGAELLRAVDGTRRPLPEPPFPGVRRASTPISAASPAAPQVVRPAAGPQWRDACAVLVGVDAYDHLRPVPAIADNVRDLGALLRSAAFGLPEHHCRLLRNPRDPRLVLRALEWAGQITARSGGTLLFYYSGHGAQDPESGRLLLSGADSLPHTPYTYLHFDRVREQITLSPAVRRLVVLDTCYSGAALDLLDDALPVPSVEGSFVMASSGATEPSREARGRRHTAFTGTLLEILANGLPGGPPMLDAEAVFEGARSACETAGWPTPRRQVRNSGSRIPVVANRWAGDRR
ncbi:TIR domain-containing protein [Streptomyces sp. NPDC048481]|uniref:caspase, EACC1-associated type n=1 Tax=Streptomyces sp. NPDC048481 TaxID=3365557 RepID=UPI00371D7BA7